ncbi:nucleotidyltransferase substrate-binding protein, HI0074 family [Syntrophotalea carbinolica DSM 2380]|uniref:Nucleotidyltransferase substrate-binding protein, HI0074 family n=1 Tax=Syntrophotalea carbinolica (strain DSM 2380 / NBRC 103641 / GraBd1) TaxID=338963 RepID=Q3A654_SYNC1|nr:nucleotidyltransferase substrate binding protein [Syntrophotalea carbinolica]ABA88153.1 nucleotidyltransferase substrate-binding protein, HI0074 family [Syntrophotalea carbinolica DSM 2380]
MTEDIRWIQRLHNWNRALAQLTRFMEKEELNELEEQGLIQSFEYNHELAWKTQKDFLEDQGYTELYGSKNVARKAFEVGLVEDGEVWLEMIESRNASSHTYNEEVTKKIVTAIVDAYFESFCKLNAKLNQLSEKGL